MASPPPNCDGGAAFSLFCLVKDPQTAQAIAIIVLALVMSGWRPRVTGLLHWWVSWSFFVSATITDGGDQMTAVLTLFLVPLCLTDPRRSHWDALAASQRTPDWVKLIALFTVVIIRIQVAGVYFHAAVGKINVEEWRDGTVMYYWLTHPQFGAPTWARGLVQFILDSPVMLVCLTWGTLAIEFGLSAALVMDKRGWPIMLLVGAAFHVAIALLQGLVTFSLAMIAAIIIFLRPMGEPLSFPMPSETGKVPAGA